MNYIAGLIFTCFVAAAIGIFIGNINKIVEQIGAQYYWKAVIFGFIVFVSIYLYRASMGFALRGGAIIRASLCLVMGAVGIPNIIALMFTGEAIQASREMLAAGISTMGAFVTIALTGFMGTLVSENSIATEST